MITTHDMDDIEELCERIIFIDEGNVGYEGSLKKFKDKFSDWKRVSIYYSKIKDKKKFETLKNTLDYENETEKMITFKIPASKSLGTYVAKIVDAIEIIDLSITEPKLENIVAKMYDINKDNKK